jgi:hypothetical protein
MLLIYFIPYIYLFISYMTVSLLENAPGLPWHERKPFTTITALAGLLLTVGAMIVATIPPTDTPDPWIFRLKVIGGAALFVIIGGVVYWRGRRSAQSARE